MTPTSRGKLARLIQVSLNGDADSVDPAVRRSLYALGDELDNRHVEILEEVRKSRRLLIGLTTTTIGAIVVGVVNALLFV
jgi:hypothetical protein